MSNAILEDHTKAITKVTLEYAIKILEHFPIEEALEILKEKRDEKS